MNFFTLTIFLTISLQFIVQYSNYSEILTMNINKPIKDFLIMYFCVTIIAVIEEIIFRGYLTDVFFKNYPDIYHLKVKIIISLLFSASHLMNAIIYPLKLVLIQMFYTFFLGMICAYQDNIFLSIFVHILYNLIGMTCPIIIVFFTKPKQIDVINIDEQQVSHSSITYAWRKIKKNDIIILSKPRSLSYSNLPKVFLLPSIDHKKEIVLCDKFDGLFDILNTKFNKFDKFDNDYLTDIDKKIIDTNVDEELIDTNVDEELNVSDVDEELNVSDMIVDFDSIDL